MRRLHWLVTGLLAAALLYQAPVILTWLTKAWQVDPYFNHGPVVVLWCLVLAGWYLFHPLGAGRYGVIKMPSPTLYLLLGFFLLLVARAAGIESLAAVGWWLALIGVVSQFVDNKRYHAIVFALSFSLLAIPWPWGVIQAVAMPMQEMSATLARWILDLSGLPVLQQGVVLDSGRFKLVVEETCSGLRSLVALGTVAAWLLGSGWGTVRQRWHLLWLIPVLILSGNAVRLLGGMLIGHFFDTEKAMVWIEDVSAYLLILLEMILLTWWLHKPQKNDDVYPVRSVSLYVMLLALVLAMLLTYISRAPDQEAAEPMRPWPVPAGWVVTGQDLTMAATDQVLRKMGEGAEASIIRMRPLQHGDIFVDLILVRSTGGSGREADDPRYCYRATGWRLLREGERTTGLASPTVVTEIVEEHPKFKGLRLDWYAYRVGAKWVADYAAFRWYQVLARITGQRSAIQVVHLSTNMKSMAESEKARSRLLLVLGAGQERAQEE